MALLIIVNIAYYVLLNRVPDNIKILSLILK
jgi:hypothetical protein